MAAAAKKYASGQQVYVLQWDMVEGNFADVMQDLGDGFKAGQYVLEHNTHPYPSVAHKCRHSMLLCRR